MFFPKSLPFQCQHLTPTCLVWKPWYNPCSLTIHSTANSNSCICKISSAPDHSTLLLPGSKLGCALGLEELVCSSGLPFHAHPTFALPFVFPKHGSHFRTSLTRSLLCSTVVFLTCWDQILQSYMIWPLLTSPTSFPTALLHPHSTPATLVSLLCRKHTGITPLCMYCPHCLTCSARYSWSSRPQLSGVLHKQLLSKTFPDP